MASCGRCGGEAPASASFCPSCAAPLRAAEGRARKTLTVLFADLVGSTALGERLDPEALRGLVGRYYDVADAAVARHGGRVAMLAGDGVLAAFGLPVLHEDDALRAVRAAWDLREGLIGLNAELAAEGAPEFRVRIALNTGELLVGADPTEPLVGDALNVAARLQEVAAPGEIVLAEPTVHAVGEGARLEPLGPRRLKGRGEPVAVWRLQEIRRSADPRRRTPLRGRQAELARLRQALRAREQGGAPLFTLIGPAGLGKSRLAAELRSEARVVGGACLAYGEGATLWPLRELVESAVGEVSRAALARLLAARPGASRARAVLEGALGIGRDPVVPGALPDAVALLARAVAGPDGLVLLWEDLHLAEPAFLDLVEALPVRLAGSGVLILATARPELLERRPSWPGETLRLAPLARRDMAALAAALAPPDVGEAALERAVEAAEGNPLFLEQLIAWIADGPPAAAEELPPGLRQLLGARLDALPERERRTLEAAAVVGRELSVAAVATLGAGPRDGPRAALEGLVERGILTRGGDSAPKGQALPVTRAFGSEGRYAFAHALLREAAYHATPKARRADLHERLAVWLEGRAGTGLEDLVALHLEAAAVLRGELGQPPRGGGAAAALLTAGRRALERGDPAAAVGLLSRAAALVPGEDPERREIVPALSRAAAGLAPGSSDSRLRQRAASALVGRTLGGYEIEAVAGAGGMGVVYRAREPGLERRVALKVIAPELAWSEGLRRQFLAESRAVAALEHPHVLPVYRAGEEDGQLFVAMRFVDGSSLAELLAADGALPGPRALTILEQVAGALDAAHSRGLVHRDVKPGNVLIDAGAGADHAYLSDFGLVAPAERSSGDGGWAGTAAYVAPELVEGTPPTPAADVYALGCVLYEALTGRAAFVGDTEPEVIAAHLRGFSAPLPSRLKPELPAALDAVVTRALARAPVERHPSAGEFTRAARAARHDVVLVHGPTEARSGRRLASRLGAMGLSVAAVGGGARAAHALALSRSACLVVGRGGLGPWARDPIEAARAPGARERGQRTVVCLLPGAPGPADPSLALLAGAEWVDLRSNGTGEEGASELARTLRPSSGTPDALASDRPPYRGLEAFDARDADLFVGREPELQRILARLRDGRFVALVGASGSGKSSLIGAALLPALAGDALHGSGRWPVARLTPGARPLGALGAALSRLPGARDAAAALHDPAGLDRALAGAARAGGAERALLVIDQLEEVFTLCADEEERRVFLAALGAAAALPAGAGVVVVALRADFYARFSANPEVAALLAGGQELLGPLGPDALRRVIEEPARRMGLRVEPALVRACLSDIAGQAEALPHLEHALLETWGRRHGSTLTIDAYIAAGGVRGSLARSAEAAYEGLPPARRELARRIFLRLTQPGHGTEDTRRPARVSELVPGPEDEAEVRAVLAALTSARLVTLRRDPAGTEVAEVTHEAVIRGWPRLRGWIDEDRETLIEARRLGEAAREWDEAGRDEALLFRGPRLGAWEARSQAELSGTEREFLDSGRALARRERAARRRRRRALTGGLASALALVSTVAGIAVWQRGVAADQRDAARSRELAAAASATLARDPQLSLLLAQRAYGTHSTLQAEQALRQAASESLLRRVIPLGGPGPADQMAFSPAGDRLAADVLGAGVQVWDVRDGRRTVELPRLRGIVVGLAFSPDGRRLLVSRDPIGRRGSLPPTGPDARLTVWDARGGRFLGAIPLGDRQFESALSPDGRWLAITSATGETSVRDWSRGRIAWRVRVAPGDEPASALGPGGRVLAECASGGRLLIWRRPGRRGPVADLGGCGRALAIAIAPGGRLLASVDTAYRLHLWRLPEGRGRLSPLPPPPGSFTPDVEPVFAPDGHLVVGRADGTVLVWDPTSRTSLLLRGHQGAVDRVAVSRDGTRIAGNGEDRTALVWDVRGAGRVLDAGHGPLTDAAMDAHGRVLATASAQGGLRVLDPSHRGPPRRVWSRGAGSVKWVAVSRDGRVITTVGREGLVRLLPVRRPEAARVLGRLPYGGAHPIALSGDGRWVAAFAGFRIRVWEDRGEPPAFLPPRASPYPLASGDATDMAFSRDGHQLVVASGLGGVYVWPVPVTGPPLALGGRPATMAVDMTPDGRFVAGGSADGVVRIWDVAARRVVRSLAGDSGVVRAVAFSSNGRLLASAGDDATARVWDWRRGVALLVLHGHRGPISTVRFTPDGGGVITTGHDGTTRVWSCAACGPMPAVLSLARLRTVRGLTPQERSTYLGQP
jgi:class 3 adenylate cyclase/WD40 repeat protein